MNHRHDDVRRSLYEIIHSMRGIAPKESVMEKLTALYPSRTVDDAVQQALDDFEMDQVIDRNTGEQGIDHKETIWYLRVLDEKEAQNLQSLKPVARALLRLLYRQETDEHTGQMRVEDARAKLAEAGYPLSDTRYLSVEGRVDTFWRIKTGQREEWFRIIPEYEKTPEYRAAEEEAERERDAHISFQTYMTEKLEDEDERIRKRAESRKKRTKQQST